MSVRIRFNLQSGINTEKKTTKKRFYHRVLVVRRYLLLTFKPWDLGNRSDWSDVFRNMFAQCVIFVGFYVCSYSYVFQTIFDFSLNTFDRALRTNSYRNPIHKIISFDLRIRNISSGHLGRTLSDACPSVTGNIANMFLDTLRLSDTPKTKIIPPDQSVRRSLRFHRYIFDLIDVTFRSLKT